MMITRGAFRAQLADLQREILRMGTVVNAALETSVRSLEHLDAAQARTVIAADDQVDALGLQIENRCLELIALQQPMARDLRVISAALRFIIDLERMGDHAVNIARVTLRLEGQPLIKPLIDIPRMADLARDMAHAALAAYVAGNVARAEALREQDHQVDALYKQVFTELEGIMRREPDSIPQALQLLLVARWLERIADHTTNLGEYVIYMVTGQRRQLND